MHIFVNLVAGLNSLVYSVPPCSTVNCVAVQMFFIVHLYGGGTTASDLPPTHDPDPRFGGELADGRVALLMFCRERRLEFSTLRRATFTSMVICHELHVEQSSSVARLIRCCRRCQAKTMTAYVCASCEVGNNNIAIQWVTLSFVETKV